MATAKVVELLRAVMIMAPAPADLERSVVKNLRVTYSYKSDGWVYVRRVFHYRELKGLRSRSRVNDFEAEFKWDRDGRSIDSAIAALEKVGGYEITDQRPKRAKSKRKR